MALKAFIDESGQRGVTKKSSDHFVMSAVICRDVNLERIPDLLTEMRGNLRRQPGQRLHWSAFSDEQRAYAAEAVGETSYLKIASVVACKRLLTHSLPDHDAAYLYTFRFLLERLSWLAKQEKTTLAYTLSHVRGFRLDRLRQYEAKLRDLEAQTEIKWDYLDPSGGGLSSDRVVEELQLADTAASATAAAFEPKPDGTNDQSYLRSLKPRLYRPRPWSKLTSYGLKMHPWNDAAKGRYPWVSRL